MSSTKIVLLANGPITNRGNEAILRGTESILRKSIPGCELVMYSVFAGPEHLHDALGALCKSLNIIYAKAKMPKRRFDFNWFLTNILKRTSLPLYHRFLFKGLSNFLRKANCGLSLGGDLYTLSFNDQPLWVFYEMDKFVMSHGVKYAYWGASVGPFTANPNFEKYFRAHANNIKVFAREVKTYDYLKNLFGTAKNLFIVADPAFAMSAKAPEDEEFLNGKIPDLSVGLNINAYVLKYFDNNKYPLERWRHDCLRLLRACLSRAGGKLYLIPHVTFWNEDPTCDHSFMKSLYAMLDASEQARVVLIPPSIDSPTTKWVISKMSLFVGARTHATIASFSSGVPTVSISYSSKSKGINMDLFGSMDYCVDAACVAKDFPRVERAIDCALENKHKIKATLQEKIPSYVEKAYSAGAILNGLIGEQ